VPLRLENTPTDIDLPSMEEIDAEETEEERLKAYRKAMLAEKDVGLALFTLFCGQPLIYDSRYGPVVE
jgi:hypothetical protein